MHQKLREDVAVQGPALAQMALGMLPWAVVWHMAWCLWAFSYSYAEPDSLLGGVTLPLLPAHVNSRITQENAAPFLVSLFAIFITLFVRGNYVRLGLSGVVDAISNKLSPPGMITGGPHVACMLASVHSRSGSIAWPSGCLTTTQQDGALLMQAGLLLCMPTAVCGMHGESGCDELCAGSLTTLQMASYSAASNGSGTST